MRIPFHSAITSVPVHPAQPVEEYESANITAFRHDIERDDIARLDRFTPDFIYIEPPFPRGYRVFNARVNKRDALGWDNMIRAAVAFIKRKRVPAYIAGDESFTRLMAGSIPVDIVSSCDSVRGIKNPRSIAFCFNTRPTGADSTLQLMDSLMAQHAVGMDFFCGYGILGRYALKHGKRAVLSDINPQCIGFIKENEEAFRKNPLP